MELGCPATIEVGQNGKLAVGCRNRFLPIGAESRWLKS